MHGSLVYIALLPAALLFLFAAVFAASGISRLAAGARTRRWPATRGRITSSGVEPELTIDGEGGTREVFQPVVRYTYEVGGKVRTGRTIGVNQEPFSSRKGAERVIRRYPEGAEVRVPHDQGDPARTVLEPGVGRSPVGYLAISALLAVAGLFALGLMCGANPAVRAGAPAVCGLAPGWATLPLR